VADTAVHPSSTPPSGLASPLSDLDRAGAAFLVRHGGRTRIEYARAVRSFLRWCALVDVEPLTARREQLEWVAAHPSKRRATARRPAPCASPPSPASTPPPSTSAWSTATPPTASAGPASGDDSPRAGLTDAQARALLEAARAAGPATPPSPGEGGG
jgi:hypothetical protein